MPLSGTIGGEPAHFFEDYLFKNASLPNAATVYGAEQTLNNTLGSLQIRGILNAPLTIPTGKSLSVVLQYQDGTNWVTDKTLFTGAPGDLAGGDLFVEMIAPSDTKRVFRIGITADFNASAVMFSCPIEMLPR